MAAKMISTGAVRSSTGMDSSSTHSRVSYYTSKIQDTIRHEMTDDGAGSFGPDGTISYASKALNVRLVNISSKAEGYKSDHEDASAFENSQGTSGSGGSSGSGSGAGSGNKGGAYGDVAVGEAVLAGSTVTVTYAETFATAQTHSMSWTPPPVTIDLCPYAQNYILPGSVRFAWMGHIFEDFEGVLIRDRTDADVGVVAGALDYSTGVARIFDYVVDPGTTATDFTLQSLWTLRQPWTTASLFFSVDAAPIRAGAGGFVLTVVDVQGTTLTANVDGQGNITGLHMRGRVEFSRGGVELQFGDFVFDADLTPEQKLEWWYDTADIGAVQPLKIWRPWPVDPTTLRYSAVSFIYLPVDVGLMGLDPAALPADGRVAFVRPGDKGVVAVTHGGVMFAPSVGMTYSLGHERLSFVQVLGADKEEIITGYTADLDAGTVTFTDLAGYPAMISVVGRTEVYRQIAEVRIDGKVKLTQPIGYAFDVGAVFSTALSQGDRFARVPRVYDQASWSGTTWFDGVDPANGVATATYNASGNPIEVSNRGGITERWALRFRAGGTVFDFIGQHLGQIASGSINEDFSPVNLAAGAPYMTVRASGWGSGWVAGNVLFVDTIGAEAPIDVVRCTQPSSPAGIDDSAWLVQRGDVGRPPESGL